ncbi:hypothetical Protein YC6258_02447 [Gynuella sunshinyii YC6258]|uniref:Uncharacterized protein n=1 Tax=Gynuella sunshinyii YC6258 TaxID=1445510 RepID=A0A0C5VJL5_9GAMM|nr:hypothetical Protein YC6258_02447 [Gynuella sunshinyii YC6258]
MNEHIRAIILLNKSKAFGLVEEFYLACNGFRHSLDPVFSLNS